MKHRRKGKPIFALLLVCALLAACAGPTSAPVTTQPDSGSTVDGSLPADAAADQTLRYVGRNFNILNPGTTGGMERALISHLWMPMFMRDFENTIHPWLAEGYDVSEDGLVYTIHIDADAVWSNGSPVTAQEAKAYWDYAFSPACIGCRISTYSAMQLIEGAEAVTNGEATEISGITAVDDKTIEIRLTAPSSIFIDTLAHIHTAIAKMDDIAKGEAWSVDGSARVNGPFKVKVWDPDTQQYEIEQNPNWWGEKKPYLQRIVATPIEDENISYIMWQNDEMDIARWLTSIREPLRATEPESFVLIPYATNFYYAVWTTIAPMDDINVRRALLHAVDWDAAINAAYEGFRNDRIMKTHLTPELRCYKEGNWPGFGYDPELAKQELAASSYGSAANLPKIRISTGGPAANYVRTAEIMAEQWKNNLGITDVEIRPGNLDAWGQEAESVQIRRESAGAVIPDSAEFLNGLWEKYEGPAGLYDPELESLVAEMNGMSREDPGFCDAVQAVESALLDKYYILPMVWELYEYNVKPWVKNVETNVDNNWYSLLDMYIAER